MDSRLSQPGLFRQCCDRFLVFWPGKMLGTTVGMTGFFFVYFWILQHPIHSPVLMPLTPVDRFIGFWPGALPLYLSLWVYVSLAPALLTDRRELVSYGIAACVLSLIGLGIFFLWPTAVPPREIEWASHPSFAFLKSVDASGNACPSLHVAFAVFTSLWFARVLPRMGATRWIRLLNWLWCLGILYSTIAVRQHVSLDVLGGAVLGLAVAFAHLRWLRISG